MNVNISPTENFKIDFLTLYTIFNLLQVLTLGFLITLYNIFNLLLVLTLGC